MEEISTTKGIMSELEKEKVKLERDKTAAVRSLKMENCKPREIFQC
jgi:hypothetical protein